MIQDCVTWLFITCLTSNGAGSSILQDRSLPKLYSVVRSRSIDTPGRINTDVDACSTIQEYHFDT